MFTFNVIAPLPPPMDLLSPLFTLNLPLTTPAGDTPENFQHSFILKTVNILISWNFQHSFILKLSCPCIRPGVIFALDFRFRFSKWFVKRNYATFRWFFIFCENFSLSIEAGFLDFVRTKRLEVKSNLLCCHWRRNSQRGISMKNLFNIFPQFRNIFV